MKAIIIAFGALGAPKVPHHLVSYLENDIQLNFTPIQRPMRCESRWQAIPAGITWAVLRQMKP
jgi:hypothetical protein